MQGGRRLGSCLWVKAKAGDGEDGSAASHRATVVLALSCERRPRSPAINNDGQLCFAPRIVSRKDGKPARASAESLAVPHHHKRANWMQEKLNEAVVVMNKSLQDINIQNMNVELVAQMFKNYQSNVLFHLEATDNLKPPS
ncbi:DASH complex subunit dad4 [Tolypocladium ophioglossoides CBS 100239]|uniref:DASH complex subunit DAD4 n=2 Tax=Hypocreales TaxID=5125 RepID=A0A0L0NG45_TOLOC|nr:DASH complex subunit dad4 [Tolypocladium ophioglossoides CBS 100239]